MIKGSFLRIGIFYLIAIVVSNVFRFDLLNIGQTIAENWVEVSIVAYLFEGIGLLLGALIALNLLKKHRLLTYSFFGTSKKWSLLMVLIPILLLTLIGIENFKNVSIHYFGFLAGIGTLVYCFFEEIGWRGYLQEELILLKEWQRVLIIGFLWYFWHLPFLTNQNVLDNLYFFCWMVFGSWGIGKVVESTKSILAATCFHMIINIALFNSTIKNGLTVNNKILIIGISIITWVIIIKTWERKQKVKTIEE